MKRIFSTLYTVLISVLITSLAFAGGIPVTIPNMPPMAPQEDHGVVFRYDPSRNPTLDFASRTKWTQTYTGTNRTRINSAGLLEAVPANTPVIDHIGTSLTPALRVEPTAANLLFSGETFTAADGWTLTGVAEPSKTEIGITGAANTASILTDNSAVVHGYYTKSISKSASDSTTYFQSVAIIKKNLSPTTHPAISIRFGTTLHKEVAYVLNLATGVLTVGANTAANGGSYCRSAGDWWIVHIWGQDNGANPLAFLHIYPALSVDGATAGAVSIQGTCIVSATMLTTGSIPSSYIEGAAAIGA